MIAHLQSSFWVSGEFDENTWSWEDCGKLLKVLGVIVAIKDGTVETCLVSLRIELQIFSIMNYYSDRYAIRSRKR